MNKDKRFVSPVGTDYTEYVTNEAQEELFNKLCEHESRCFRPIKECIVDVVAALNLGRQLKGKRPNVSYQGRPQDN